MEKNLDSYNSLGDFLKTNPAITIWYQPRVTIRQLINTSPEKYVIIFAILSGIYRTLDQSIKRGISEQLSLSWFLVVVLLGGALLGIISLYLTGVALHFVGMIFGGEGKPEQVRTVIAWSSIPDGILLLLTLPALLIGGSSWLIASPQTRDMVSVLFSEIFLFPVVFVFFILRSIIFIGGLAEINGFSILKALITVVIGYIIMAIPFLCLIGMLVSL